MDSGAYDSALQVINADGSGLKRLTDYGNIEKAAWSPDGSRIAFLFSPVGDWAGNDLYVMSPDGSNKIKLNRYISGGIKEFDWSPDSSQIIFTSSAIDDSPPIGGGNQSTYIINTDGTNPKQLIDDREIHLINWSPDGNRIVFREGSVGRHELYTMNPEGSNVIQLTDFSSYDSNIIPLLHWSPDGSRIAFNVIHDTTELFVIDSDGSNPVIIVSDDGHRGVIGWTPDSSKVLFLQQYSGGMDIHIINADGSNETNLTANLDDVIGDPMLSPDGQRLLFSSDRNDLSDNGINNLDIYVMDIDGSVIMRLTRYQRSNYSNRGAIWAPDCSKILFETRRHPKQELAGGV
jgi:TolB protein